MKNGFSTDWTTYQIEEPNQNRFWYNQLFGVYAVHLLHYAVSSCPKLLCRLSGW